jgi:hypothetical protein
MKNEIWKDIKDYEGFYQVSNTGFVRSVSRIVRKWDGEKMHHGQLLKGDKSKTGYMRVTLSKKDVKKRFLVHQIVARHFLEPRPGVDHIDHINGDPTDNRVSNLRWATPKENSNNPITLQRFRKAKAGVPFPEKARIEGRRVVSRPVYMLSPIDGAVIMRFDSISDAAKYLNISSQNVNQACNGKRKSAGGYGFRYICK